METLILGGVGIVISLIVTYFKPVANWFYNVLSPDYKGLVMAGIALVVSGAIYGLSCTGWFDFVPCTQASIVELAKAWITLLVTNQLTYLLTPVSKFKVVA